MQLLMKSRSVKGFSFNKSYLFFLFLGFFILLTSQSAFSRHLIGGSITYKYLGTTSNGKLKFKVTVDMFRDCSDSTGALFFDQTITLAIYERKPGDAFGDTLLTDSLVIPLASDMSVSPPSSAKNCTVKPITCIHEGLYNGTLLVNPSSYGYYLEYQRCCRNTMVNLPLNIGQTYFAVIPPTTIINTTPTFSVVPAPYFCAQDTVSISYGATEPDGDSLVYSLGWPSQGGDQINVIPPPSDTFKGVPLAPYNSGYSFQYPMSKSGFASIDPYTGVVTVYAPLVGRYAIAVDVKEYRNHALISTTRRDIQLITVGGCPKQQPPTRIPIFDSLAIDRNTSNTYTIEAGKRLSFNIRYKATNSNVTKFTASGFFTNGGIFTHQPIFNYNLDSGFATAYFDWQTACKDGSAAPYTFTVAVSDTGCPAKTTYQSYKIYVLKGPDHISGALKICKDTSLTVYTTNHPSIGDTLIWSVNGGSFTRTPNDSSITVNWGTSTSGIIKVIGANDAGCYSDTVVISVKISPKPKPPIINGPSVTCSGYLIPYSISGNSILKYTWHIQGGIIVKSDSLKKNILVSWNLGDSNSLSVSGIDTNLCESDSSYMMISTKQGSNDSIVGDTLVCPNNSIHYSATSKPNTTYFWKIIGGTQTSGGNTSLIQVKWGDKGIGYVEVYEQFPKGCAGDTIILKVVKDYALVIGAIKGKNIICEQSKGIPYSVSGSNNFSYSWQISNGNIVSGNGTQNITVNWGSAGSGKLIVTKTSYDSVNQEACSSTPLSLPINILPIPNPSEISGSKDICEKDTAVLRITGSQGSSFTWKINGTISNDSADSLIIIDRNAHNPADTFNIQVSENSIDGCPGPVRYFKLVVHKVPDSTGINGPIKVCAPNLSGIEYKVNGIATSTYNWTVNGGVIVSGNLTNTIIVNWQAEGNRSITVQEVNDLGCPGPVNILKISVDSVAIDMKLVTTEEGNDKVIDVFWSDKNTDFLGHYYRIYRETAGEDFFRLIDSVPNTRNYYVDRNVNTSSNIYRYKIGVENSCGNTISSDIHRSIKLDAYFDNDTLIHLDWNSYQGWPVAIYNVNNILDNDTSQIIYGFTNDTNYIVIKTLEGFRECFRIAAKEVGAPNIISLSNKTCIDFDPLLWIPDAFTPNNDTHNETFHVFASNYKTYQLDIYNRWGEHIFGSNDPAKQWDGKFEGADAPEGVYLYQVNIIGIKKNIYKSGTITLMR